MNKELKIITPPSPLRERYTDKPFPPYRFVPGVNPHPTENPQGHSYGALEEHVEAFGSKEWRTNKTYLYGVDLYNNAFWWEAHEAFETLWGVVPKNDTRSHFVQGLIKISAAFLKWHLQEWKGAGLLYSGARKHLDIVAEVHPRYMGLDLTRYLGQLEKHFSFNLKQSSTWPSPTEQYPFIELEG